MLIAVGKRIAMTAELLMNVVNNVDKRAITKRNVIGESTIPENSFSASHNAAPVSAMTSPKQIAPPYIRTMAQLIWVSTIFQVIKFRTNKRTMDMMAILAIPN